MEPFIGQIMMFAGTFPPRGWAFCDGQLLPISGNEALFSLLGTTYGGDGRNNFALPDLRGRIPMHPGTGPGLTPKSLGQKGGEENVTLTVQQMPAHSHNVSVNVNRSTAEESDPVDNVIARHTAGFNEDIISHSDYLGGVNESNTGGGASHNNMQPFLCVSFCIALTGIFPSRN